MASKSGDDTSSFDPSQYAPPEGESLTTPESARENVPQFDRPYSTDDLYATGVPSLEDLFADAATETAHAAQEAETVASPGAMPPLGSPPPVAPLPAAPTPPKRRLPWAWIAAVVVVLLGIGAGAIAVSARAGDSAEVAEPAPGTKDPQTNGVGTATDGNKGSSGTGDKTKPAAIVLPECEQLDPVAQKPTDEMLAKGMDVNHGEQAFGTDNRDVFIGDSTRAAIAETTQIRACQYAFHLESGTRLIAAEVPDDARDALIGVMEADSEITQSTIGKAKLFTWEEYVPEGHMPYRFTAHIFLDNAWVLIITGQEFEEQIQAAYDSLVAANPGLGE